MSALLRRAECRSRKLAKAMRQPIPLLACSGLKGQDGSSYCDWKATSLCGKCSLGAAEHRWMRSKVREQSDSLEVSDLGLPAISMLGSLDAYQSGPTYLTTLDVEHWREASVRLCETSTHSCLRVLQFVASVLPRPITMSFFEDDDEPPEAVALGMLDCHFVCC